MRWVGSKSRWPSRSSKGVDTCSTVVTHEFAAPREMNQIFEDVGDQQFGVLHHEAQGVAFDRSPDDDI